MCCQTIIKQVGLVKDLNIHIHGIPYIFNLIVIDNNVTNASFYMLLAWGGGGGTLFKKSKIHMSKRYRVQYIDCWVKI
jgi:hypothetical protein